MPRRSRPSSSTASAISASRSASSRSMRFSARCNSTPSSPRRPTWRTTPFPFLGHDVDALTVTCILLFVGAMGKSAQIGLHTWLPDAMEGPTPVSALIHAATMVTAGVFMLARLSPLFEYAPVALAVVVVIGAHHRDLRRHHRHGAERHQARHRLFDLQPVGLHVHRRRRLGLWRGDLPPHDPRLLQGAPVPQRRLGHPCHVGRAGHAQDGRAVAPPQEDRDR